MNLIRGILLEVEGEEPKPDLSKWSNEQKAYHAVILIEAGLIKGAAVENHYRTHHYTAELNRLNLHLTE